MAQASPIPLMGIDHVVIRVRDLEPMLAYKFQPFEPPALLSQLQSHGIDAKATLQSRFGTDGDGPSIQFTDPEGNGIELKGY
ncbi:MAG TPA: hypothetical protein DEO90_00985 [Synechococcales bacterium UBA8647]|nr:hypothetical protein [Synechococcales bacterium UBA8647]